MAEQPDIKRIISSLDSPLEAQRERAIEALVKSNDIRAIHALQRVASTDESVRLRYLAKKALFVLKRRLSKDIPEEGPDSVVGLKPSSVRLDKVRDIFNSGDSSKKLSLLKVIAKHKLKQTVTLLLEAAKTEPDALVRSNIIIVVGMVGDEKNIKDIAGHLHDTDPRVRANTIEALEYTNHPNAYPIIVNALGDSDNRIRANAIKALKNYGKVNVINLLRKMLRSDQVWMRDSAAYALSMVAKNEALPLLLEALKDEHESIRKRAKEGLTNLGQRGNAAAQKAVKELEKLGSEIPPPIDLSHLIDLTEPDVQRENLLSSRDPQVKMRELRKIVEEQDTDRLLDVIELAQTEEDGFIKANAIIALGKLGDENLIDTLADYLSSPIDRVRANAIEALAMIGGEKVHPLLIPHLDDKNNRCKANAVIALKNHPYVSILKPLKQMVESDELLMRKSAFYAITDIATDEVIPLLGILYGDIDDEVRKNAHHFLQMMSEQGNGQAQQILDDAPSQRELSPLESLTGDFFDDGDLAEAERKLKESSPPSTETSTSGLLDSGLVELDSAIDLGFSFDGSDISSPSSNETAAASEKAPVIEELSELEEFEFDDVSDTDGNLEEAPAPRAFHESVEEKPFRYTIDNFIALSTEKKRAIIEELKNEVTFQAYLFLREVLNDKDFEVKCLAKVALKNFEAEDFAGVEPPKDQERSWLFTKPEVETVEYQGLKKTIMLSRDLNDKAQTYEVSKRWAGPFPDEFPILNALREDTQEMLQFILGDEEVRFALVCFHHDRLKPFLEGRRSLDGNRFANVVTLAPAINRIEPYSPTAKFLREIKRPIYLLAVFTDDRLVLFLRGPLETSFAKYLAINYQMIDNVDCITVSKSLQTLVLHIHNDYVELPEMFSYYAKKINDFITQRTIENLKKEQISGRFNPEEELKKLETLLKAGAITSKDYKARKARIERLLALSGVHSKEAFEEVLKEHRAKNKKK